MRWALAPSTEGSPSISARKSIRLFRCADSAILAWQVGRHGSRLRRLRRELLPEPAEDSEPESLASEAARVRCARSIAAPTPGLADNVPRSLSASSPSGSPCAKTTPTQPSGFGVYTRYLIELELGHYLAQRRAANRITQTRRQNFSVKRRRTGSAREAPGGEPCRKARRRSAFACNTG
jgi:hypothetical protein